MDEQVDTPLLIRSTINDFGMISYQWTLPSGERFEGVPPNNSLSETYTNTHVMDRKYQIKISQDMYSKVISNLQMISNTDVFLFEQLLTVLETSSLPNASLWGRYLSEQTIYDEGVDICRQLIVSMPYLSQLSADTNQNIYDVLKRSVSITELLGVQYMNTIILKTWVDRGIINNDWTQEGLDFIEANFEAIFLIKDEIKLSGRVDVERIKNMINAAPSLSSGAL